MQRARSRASRCPTVVHAFAWPSPAVGWALAHSTALGSGQSVAGRPCVSSGVACAAWAGAGEPCLSGDPDSLMQRARSRASRCSSAIHAFAWLSLAVGWALAHSTACCGLSTARLPGWLANPIILICSHACDRMSRDVMSCAMERKAAKRAPLASLAEVQGVLAHVV